MLYLFESGSLKIFSILVFPCINPSNPPQVDAGLSESQPESEAIFIVSLKSPFP